MQPCVETALARRRHIGQAPTINLFRREVGTAKDRHRLRKNRIVSPDEIADQPGRKNDQPREYKHTDLHNHFSLAAYENGDDEPQRNRGQQHGHGRQLHTARKARHDAGKGHDPTAIFQRMDRSPCPSDRQSAEQ